MAKSTNRRFYWIKLKKDFFETRFIKRLRTMPNGDTYTIIYLKLLLKTVENNGFYYYEGIDEDIYSEIALDLDESLEAVKNTVNYLVQKNLMTISENEAELYQMDEMVGSETASTRRARKSREKSKSVAMQHQCNTNATHCNNLQQKCNVEKEKEKDKEIDKEIDKELEKEQEKELEQKEKVKKEKKPKEAHNSIIENYTINEDLREALKGFVEMRKEIKKPITTKGLKIALGKLDKWALDDLTKIDIVNQSIERSWSGLFPLNKNNNQYNQEQKKKSRIEELLF